MRDLIVRLTVGLALSTSVACADTEGDGNITTETRAITEPFTRLLAGDGVLVELTVTPGATQSVEVVADANLQPKIEIGTFERVLTIQADGIAPSVQPIVRVTASDMRSITSNENPTTVIATGVMVADAGDIFAVGASQGGAVEVAGTCTDLIAISTGESIVRASALVCERGDLEVLGKALLEVNLTESVRLRGSGEARVRIAGSPPMVEQNVDDDVTVTIE